MNGKLTAAFVKNMKQPGVYSDKNGMGLRLRVKEDGRKHWVQRYAINGKTREAGLGSYPIVTLGMAREQALDNKRAVRRGLDPIAERQKARALMTFEDAVNEYLTIRASEYRSDKHRKQWRSTLDTYAVPLIGARAVRDVTVQDVLGVLKPIWETKTETARRLRQRMEAVLAWSIVSGNRENANPALWKGNLSELLPKPDRIAQKKNHPAVQFSDMPRFWKELQKREGMGALALRFIALTLARSGEVRGMTWAEVDLEGALWIIPAGRMKARREHRVPLSDMAARFLETIPRRVGCDYVFFSQKGGQLSDMSISAVMRRMDEDHQTKGKKRFLDARSDLPAVPHGLRSTFRDWAAEQGHDHVLAELVLAHHVGSTVERAYRRSDLVKRRRDLMGAWAGAIG